MSCVETQDLKIDQYQAIAFSASQLDDRSLKISEGEPARRHRAANAQTVYTQCAQSAQPGREYIACLHEGKHHECTRVEGAASSFEGFV